MSPYSIMRHRKGTMHVANSMINNRDVELESKKLQVGRPQPLKLYVKGHEDAVVA